LKLETPIKVREAVASDRHAAEEVTRVAFAENRAIYEPTLLARERASSDAEDFVRLVAAGADDAVIGTLLYRVEGDCLHVRALAVHPGWRGRAPTNQLRRRPEARARNHRDEEPMTVTDEAIETALDIVREECLRHEVFVCVECLTHALARRLATEPQIERAALGALDDAVVDGAGERTMSFANRDETLSDL
jgi:N-acetylglutamate synthase-like GNAT family acetyltransferase